MATDVSIYKGQWQSCDLVLRNRNVSPGKLEKARANVSICVFKAGPVVLTGFVELRTIDTLLMKAFAPIVLPSAAISRALLLDGRQTLAPT